MGNEYSFQNAATCNIAIMRLSISIGDYMGLHNISQLLRKYKVGDSIFTPTKTDFEGRVQEEH
jgi:hypothetical protein